MEREKQAEQAETRVRRDQFWLICMFAPSSEMRENQRIRMRIDLGVLSSFDERGEKREEQEEINSS